MGMALHSVPELYTGLIKKPFTAVSPAPYFWPVPQFSLMIGMAVALAASPGGIKIFGEELPVYWRNTASVHNSLAYFLGKPLISLYRIVCSSLHFSAILYYISSPIIPFWVQFCMVTLMYFGVFGLAAFVLVIVKRENGGLLSIVISMFSAETLLVYQHVYDSELSNYTITSNRTMFDFIMMAVIVCAWRLLAFLAMISFNRHKQK
jgi:hypothetical protein